LFVDIQRVLVLVATDVDALCACKILQVSSYRNTHTYAFDLEAVGGLTSMQLHTQL